MKILTIIGSYIKTHIITTAVVGTVVVGGTIATPIIVNNINDNQNKVNTEIKEPNKQEVENKTCEDGYELVDNECMEIKQEEPKENENTNNESTTNTNKPNTNTPTTKPNNNKPSTNKPNTTKPQENKPQETKPTCNDISCKITESNRVVYYNGKMLFGIKVFQPSGYGYDVDGWQYNSSLIQSLSKEDRTYILNNYFKKETYCDTNPRTSTNCLIYSAFEERMDDLNKGSKDEIYQYDMAVNNYTTCIAYLQNGTLLEGYDKERMDHMCHQEDNLPFKYTIEDFQHKYNENRKYYNLHTKSINECNSHKQAYQTTRSLLRK